MRVSFLPCLGLSFHILSGDSAKELFGPVLLLILTAVSWYFRHADKKTISINPYIE